MIASRASSSRSRAFSRRLTQKTRHIFLGIPVQRACGIIVDRGFEALEQVLVIDDVAIFLVFAIEPVDAANRLKQAVIMHLLVDVEIGRGRCVKTGQKLIDNDEKLHLPRLVHKFLLGILFEFFGVLAVQHLIIDFVLPQGSVKPSPLDSPLISFGDGL